MQITVDSEVFYQALRIANKMGHDGTRIITSQYIPARDVTGKDHVAFYTDNGPTDISEVW